MKTVYKYPIAIEDFITLELPKRAVVLCVQMQQGQPNIWALVDPEQPTETRTFLMVGTGHPIMEESYFRMVYVGTFQLHEGELVFHLFEVWK